MLEKTAFVKRDTLKRLEDLDMAGEDEDSKELQKPEMTHSRLRINRVLTNPAPPKLWHMSLFSAVNDDVGVDVGYLDLTEAFNLYHAVKGGTAGEEPTVNVYITDRFYLTPQSALDMLHTAQSVIEHFQKRGALPQDLSKATQFLTTEKVT